MASTKDEFAPHSLVPTDASANVVALADGASCAAGADCSAAEEEDAMSITIDGYLLRVTDVITRLLCR